MADNVTLQATTNEWDAPVIFARYPDGSTYLSRGDEPRPGWNHRLDYPHGVVLVNGQLSPFDVRRQPDDVLAAQLAQAERQLAAAEEAAAHRCTCGHRRDHHADSSGLCWVGYGRPGAPCDCMIFERASDG